jgi:hypothetical protein
MEMEPNPNLMASLPTVGRAVVLLVLRSSLDVDATVQWMDRRRSANAVVCPAPAAPARSRQSDVPTIGVPKDE